MQHQHDVGVIAGSVSGVVGNVAFGANLADISTWYLGVAQGLLQRIMSGYAQARSSSLTYLTRHATLNRAAVDVVPGSLDTAALARRLEIVGPVGFKTAIAAGQSEAEALRHMATNMAGVADEAVRNGDRDVIVRTAQHGSGLVGWRRRLSGHGCGFCSMLASRGAVYVSRQTAVLAYGAHAYHPHCHCWAEPLYRRGPEPPEVKALQRQWQRVTAGHSGKDAQRVWRQHWERNATPEARARYGIPEPAREPARLASMPAGGFAEPGAAVRVRQALAAAETPEAVSRALEAEYARLTGRQLQAEFAGSVDTAREHAEGVLRSVEAHPDMRIDVVRTGQTQKLKAYADADPDAFEVVFSDDWSSVARRRDYLEALAGDEHAGWHPGGVGNPAGVASHETAHLFDPGHLDVDRRIDALLFAEQRRTGVPIERALREQVSGYATRNHREMIAEAFADVTMNGERASALSRSIVRIVEEEHGVGGVSGVGRLATVPREALSPTGVGGLSSNAGIRAGQIENRIREAVAELSPGTRGFAQVADLRERIVGAEVSEDEFRAVLQSMKNRPDVLTRSPYIGRPGLTAPTPGLQAARARRAADIAEIRIEGGYRPVELVPSEKKIAAKAAAKVAAPKAPTLASLRQVVADAGITAPVGAPRAVIENLVDALGRGVAPAQAREAAVRELLELRAMVGDKLAQTAAALENGASEKTMSFYAKQLRRLSSGEGGLGYPTRAVPELGKPLQDLIAALERGDAAAAKTALPKAVTGSKLKTLGEPGRVVSRTTLGRDVEWVGSGRGDVVEVLHPGYSSTLEGKTVTVTKPSVRTATPEQAQAFRAAQPVKRTPAKAAAPKAPVQRGTAFTPPERKPVRTSVETQHSAGPSGEVRVTRISDQRIEGRALLEHAQIIAGLNPNDVAAYLDWHGFTKVELDQIRQRLYRLMQGDTSMRLAANIKALPFSKNEVRDLIVRDAALANSGATAEMRAAAKKYVAELNKAPRVPAPPAPAKMSLPALRTELDKVMERAGATADLSTVPKQALADMVTRARTLPAGELKAEIGRWRQVVIDRRRDVADLLSQADQLVDAGATAATLGARGAGIVRRWEQAAAGWPDLAEARKVVAAMQTGDARKIRAAIKAAQRKLGLEQIGEDAGTVARYDRATMTPISGAKIPADAHVVVVRPGYRMADGTVLSKPVVEEAAGKDIGLPSRDVPSIREILDRRAAIDPSDQKGLRALEQDVERAVNGQYGGLRAQVIKAYLRATDEVSYSGMIVDARGQTVGKFTRVVVRQPDGTFVARHSLLELDRKVQGSGFADAFNANLLDWYRRSGVTQVRLMANIDVGGYAWARKGFDFLDQRAADHFLDQASAKIAGALAKFSRSGQLPRGLTEQDLHDLEAYIRDRILGRVKASAPEIADFGRKTGEGGKRAMWAGKWLMLGSDWQGVLYL